MKHLYLLLLLTIPFLGRSQTGNGKTTLYLLVEKNCQTLDTFMRQDGALITKETYSYDSIGREIARFYEELPMGTFWQNLRTDTNFYDTTGYISSHYSYALDTSGKKIIYNSRYTLRDIYTYKNNYKERIKNEGQYDTSQHKWIQMSQSTNYYTINGKDSIINDGYYRYFYYYDNKQNDTQVVTQYYGLYGGRRFYNFEQDRYIYINDKLIEEDVNYIADSIKEKWVHSIKYSYYYSQIGQLFRQDDEFYYINNNNYVETEFFTYDNMGNIIKDSLTEFYNGNFHFKENLYQRMYDNNHNLIEEIIPLILVLENYQRDHPYTTARYMDCTYTYRKIVGIEPEEKPGYKLEVYPVPMEDALHVKLKTKHKAPAVLTLMDALGRTIYTQTIPPEAETILPTQNLAHGFYMLKVQQGKSYLVQKVVK